MNGSRAPGPVARAGIALAVRCLPRRERARYRQEFLAELHALPPSTQLLLTAGVLSHVLALRAALGAVPSSIEEGGMRKSPFWRSFRCHVLRWHDWTTFTNPDGERYRACSVCDTDEPSAAFPRGFPLTG